MALIRCPNCDTLHDLDGAMFATGPRKVRCASCREVWLASDGTPSRPPPSPAEFQLPPAPMAAPPAPPPEAAQPDFDQIDIGPAMSAAQESDRPATLPETDFPSPSAPALSPTPAPPGTPAAAAPMAAIPMAAAPGAVDTPGAEDEPAKRREERRKNRPPAPARAAKPARQPAAFAVVLAAASLGTIATLTFMRHETVRVIPHAAVIFEAIGLPVTRHSFDISEVRSRLVREDSRDTLEVTATLVNLTRERQRIPVLRLALHNSGGQDIYVWTATADVPELGPGERTTIRRRLANPPAEAQSVLVRFLAKDDIVAAIR